MEPRPGVGAGSWCTFCFAAWEVKRSTPEAKAKLLRNFESKIEKTAGCWHWKAGKSDTGYGSIGVEGKTCHAHRVAYELYVGPIPPGLQIDHTCRNRACVNPLHLDAVTAKENQRRGKNGALKKTCAMGHPWTDEHIYLRPGNGHRMCGTCRNTRNKLGSAQAGS